jgi:hypothetical protein
MATTCSVSPLHTELTKSDFVNGLLSEGVRHPTCRNPILRPTFRDKDGNA